MPIETLKFLYNAIVQPHFDYSDIVNDSTSKANKDRLQKLKTRTCRLITRSGPCTNRIPMFHELNWLSLQYRRDFYKIVMVYKCRNSLAPQYVTLSMQIMTFITTTLEMPHWELLNMPKQELHIIIVPLYYLVKGYGMIFQRILNFVHFYLVLKMPCRRIWMFKLQFKKVCLVDNIFLPILIYILLPILNV